MSPVKYPEEAHFIAREEMGQNIALASVQGAAARLPGLEAWQKGSIRRRPVEIYDINGKLLFLDYAITSGAEVVGTARAAASRVLGPPVVAYEAGPRTWNYNQAVEKLTPKVTRAHPNWKLHDTKLVCYSYPKLGVMFSMSDDRGKAQRLIFDVASLDPVPEAPIGKEVEGAFAWSFYDTLSDAQRERRLAVYDESNAIRKQLPAEKQLALQQQTSIAKLTALVAVPLYLTVTKELQFCSHYAYTEARSHHCFSLHAQQVNDYCAVATCQMILCYYRYYYTQDQIAPQLGYSPGGGCPSDQSAGYEALTCNHLNATYDSSPTWEEARNQIDALHPMKSGIAGHARSCAGYSYVKSTLIGGAISQKKLYIYDPWPWNADYKLGGTVYWESWDSITHTNYVFTQLTCP